MAPYQKRGKPMRAEKLRRFAQASAKPSTETAEVVDLDERRRSMREFGRPGPPKLKKRR